MGGRHHAYRMLLVFCVRVRTVKTGLGFANTRGGLVIAVTTERRSTDPEDGSNGLVSYGWFAIQLLRW